MMNRRNAFAIAAIATLCLSTASVARDSRTASSTVTKDGTPDLEQVWVKDGSSVHSVGNLQLHVCNWGAFGSQPGSREPTAEAPSAQWPANSGVEYLYYAGLWVGARLNGIPVVSTAAFEDEFQPDPRDPLVRVYRSFESAMGGARYPAPADDDLDGRVDEDWLNGRDDDGDGAVDEDFAAIGKQMFCCWFTDDQPNSVVKFPEHTPLHLTVRQESYQWEDPAFYDFVGIEYRITNTGNEPLEDVYIGFFIDGDVGPRTDDDPSIDDATGYWEGIVCAERGSRVIPVWVSIAFFYDADGDNGRAPGCLGVLFLGHSTDPLEQTAPKRVGITSYQNFARDQLYEAGGDPTNDFQRYELMSKKSKDRNQTKPLDYRALMSVGAFRELLPDSTMILQVAFCCGNGVDGMKRAAASAALAYQGNWFNVDGNALTGVDGRETPVYGPVSSIEPDSCDGEAETMSAARDEIIWINADCRREIELFIDRSCPQGNAPFVDYQTGVNGREKQVHWLVGSAPLPPVMRIIPENRRITLLWDNRSEVTPDASTLEYDFEGYRIWRADGWTRPFGTSILTGPSRDLWQLIIERDLVNGLGPDLDFKKPYSQGGWEYEPIVGRSDRNDIIEYFEQSLYQYPTDAVPCPPGLSELECDTIEALARYNLGFEGGRQYYRYVDETVHNGMHYFYAVISFDHVIADGVPVKMGYYGDPSSNFQYTTPISTAQSAAEYRAEDIYVVPNPATRESLAPWQLMPNNADPTGIKVEFRNLPECRSTIRIYTLAGDLVEVLHHDGTGGNGSHAWDLVSRNGQDVTSGIYLFVVESESGALERAIGKFVVIR